MKNKRRPIGPIVEIMLLAGIISTVGLFCNIFGVSGYITESKTLETTMITVNNIFTKGGIKYILEKSLTNFKGLEALAMVIMSLIAVSIMESSGLLKQVFTPLSKIKSKYITLLVMFVGIISTILGDYSYAILLPISGILYQYTHRNPTLGVITMFVAITIGYGVGIIYNYQTYELGLITQISAQDITDTYNYDLSSNLFFMIASTIILSIIGTLIIERFAKKFPRNDYKDQLNISRKANRITQIVLMLFVLVFIYCIIPNLPLSGMLLADNEPTYIAKLFGPTAPLRDGLMFIIIGVLMVCGFIYGKVSRNIKNSSDYSKALTTMFENTGYIFVLLFFVSVLYGILNYTKLDTVIVTNIIDLVGRSNLSGLILVIVTFLSIVIMTIFIPSTITKWTLIAPVFVPLLMRANISPEFTQSIFVAADSVGKLFCPVYIYLIITIGFIYKYDKDNVTSIIQTMKKIMPVILVLSITWFAIVIGWYLTGLPIGPDTVITL